MSLAGLRRATRRTGSPATRSPRLGARARVAHRAAVEPAFPEDRCDWLRRQTAGELGSLRDQPDVVTGWAFLEQLYAPHPLGRPIQGDAAALGAPGSRRTARAFHCAGSAAASSWRSRATSTRRWCARFADLCAALAGAGERAPAARAAGGVRAPRGGAAAGRPGAPVPRSPDRAARAPRLPGARAPVGRAGRGQRSRRADPDAHPRARGPGLHGDRGHRFGRRIARPLVAATSAPRRDGGSGGGGGARRARAPARRGCTARRSRTPARTCSAASRSGARPRGSGPTCSPKRSSTGCRSIARTGSPNDRGARPRRRRGGAAATREAGCAARHSGSAPIAVAIAADRREP